MRVHKNVNRSHASPTTRDFLKQQPRMQHFFGDGVEKKEMINQLNKEKHFFEKKNHKRLDFLIFTFVYYSHPLADRRN